MKIAIIGSGISGLTCGHYLHAKHDVTIFESNDYIGGHTATIDIEHDGESHAIDTGFIVYNDRTYPNFIEMLERVGVKGKPTQMSFSVRNDVTGLEYNGHTVTTLFAQKRNWLNPKFYHFIWEILRFNKLAKRYVDSVKGCDLTLGDFLNEQDFSDYFSENYILPMGAAIWSSTLADMRAFPLYFFLRFFLNHGLLDITNRPQWYVVEGGSRAYIDPLTDGFKERILLNCPVTSVKRDITGVNILVNDQSYRFDQVIFACHSDQALKMLDEPTPEEFSILGNMAYQSNEVILHTDRSLLPKAPSAWASWNYLIEGKENQQFASPSLTYNMNILQHIESKHTFCVSLNSSEHILQDKIIRTFNYYHPVFNTAVIQAQARKPEINGKNNTWFCGAYWRNGFHEDGVKSALDVVEGISQRVEVMARQEAAS